jgi:hypothetical protein
MTALNFTDFLIEGLMLFKNNRGTYLIRDAYFMFTLEYPIKKLPVTNKHATVTLITVKSRTAAGMYS